MSRIRIAMRLTAGLIGILLGTWACYGVYQQVLSYKYARFIDVLPKFSWTDEVGEWSAIVALLLGAFFLCRFAFTPAGPGNLSKAPSPPL